MCKDGFAPGYSFTCKSCLGDSAQSAQWVAIIVFIMMMGVVSFIALQLVKVVQPPIPDVADGFGSEDGNHDAAIDADADPEAGAHDKKVGHVCCSVAVVYPEGSEQREVGKVFCVA